MQGGFYPEEYWQIFEAVQKSYPKFISEKFKIGETNSGRPIEAFTMGYNMDLVCSTSDLKKLNRSVLLFDAAHHSREILSVSMMLQILLQNLLSIISSLEKSKTENLWLNLVLFNIPIVNVDGYNSISESHQAKIYGHIFMNEGQWIRKNMKPTDGRVCQWNAQGVDLNRNYPWKFGYDNKGSSSDPCAEDYRGTKPFSEPETRAIKEVIETLDGLVMSAMNFHAWGNLWVMPFCYQNDPEQALREMPEGYLRYRYLKDTLNWPVKAIIGNAYQTVEYVANGEAADWMFGEKKITAYSPELGNKEHYSEGFWVAAGKHGDILLTDYALVESFLEAHHVKLDLIRVQLPDMKNLLTEKKLMSFLGVNDLKFSPRIPTKAANYFDGRTLEAAPEPDADSNAEDPFVTFYKNLDKVLHDFKPNFYFIFFNHGISTFKDLKLQIRLSSEFAYFLDRISIASYQFEDIHKYLHPTTLSKPDRTNQPNRDFFAELIDSIPIESLDYQTKKFTIAPHDPSKETAMIELQGVDIERFSYFIFKFEMKSFTLTKTFDIDLLKQGSKDPVFLGDG